MQKCSTFLQSPSYLSWWPEWCHNKPSSTEAPRPYGRNQQGAETSASRKAPATWWHIQKKNKQNVWSNTHETQNRCFWSHCLDCCAVSAHDIMSRWWKEWQWERKQTAKLEPGMVRVWHDEMMSETTGDGHDELFWGEHKQTVNAEGQCMSHQLRTGRILRDWVHFLSTFWRNEPRNSTS